MRPSCRDPSSWKDTGHTRQSYREVEGVGQQPAKGIGLTLTKSLRIYMCWTKAIVGNSCIYELNCYLEPGEDEQIKNRAARISEIAADILKQDSQARIVVCGDFNK